MRELLQYLFKQLPAGILNTLLILTLVLVVYFAKTERTAALTNIEEQKKWDEQQDKHLNQLDKQIATLTADVTLLVELEKQDKLSSDQQQALQTQTAQQLGRALALIEQHLSADRASRAGVR